MLANFEAQLERLQSIVKSLDDPSLPLAEMLELYAEGMAIAQDCRTDLESATQTIREIRNTAPSETTYDPDDFPF